VGDEVGTFEEQKYIAEAVALQGTVQGDPVSVLRERERERETFKAISVTISTLQQYI